VQELFIFTQIDFVCKRYFDDLLDHILDSLLSSLSMILFAKDIAISIFSYIFSQEQFNQSNTSCSQEQFHLSSSTILLIKYTTTNKKQFQNVYISQQLKVSTRNYS